MRITTKQGIDLLGISETLLLLLSLVLLVTAGVYQPLLWVSLGMMAFLWLVRWLSQGYPTRRTPLDVPMLLFLLSSLAGLWPSYDLTRSLPLFLMIVGGVALYYLLVNNCTTEHSRHILTAGSSLLALVVSVYFITQYRHADYSQKFDLVTQLGLATSRIFPKVGAFQPYTNSVATFLEGIMPLALAMAISERRPWLRAFHSLCATTTALALLMTASRGAWVALVLCGIIWLCTRFHRMGMVFAAIILISVVVLWAYLVFNNDVALNSIPIIGTRLVSLFAGTGSRLELYRNSLWLIRDFLFTGIGLGDVFAMVYSRYALLIQVPFLTYSHNLFLEIWLGQGLLGLLSFLSLIAVFYLFVGRVLNHLAKMEERAPSAVFQGCWLGVTATLIHGLFDARQYADSWTLPVLFVLLGLAVGTGLSIAQIGRDSPSRHAVVGLEYPPRRLRAEHLAIYFILALTCLSLCFALYKPVLAAVHANLGSVYQAKGELAPNLTNGEPELYLYLAKAHYDKAIRCAPDDHTARQRLGRLAVDAGRYEEGVTHLELAHQAAPSSFATRKALGLAYVWVGRLDEAEPLLRGAKDIVQELNTWGWWRGTQGEDSLAINAYRMSLRLEPGQVAVQQVLADLVQDEGSVE
jgi:putative inorganic carbon (HCO3(-)) transporter